MSGTGTAPGADDGWLAKVLAGDPLACGLLDLARSLPADEWAAFVRCGERMAAGMPAAEAEVLMRKECGRAAAEGHLAQAQRLTPSAGASLAPERWDAPPRLPLPTFLRSALRRRI